MIGGTQRSRGAWGKIVGLVLCSMLLAVSSCRFPGAVRPTVKIGLVAPFEGRYRYVGYDVIYAVKLALQEANAAGGLGGYGVELAAYDDGADPAMAVEQARKLAADSEVVAVIGHFREGTTAAALDTYEEIGAPLVSPTALAPVADALAGELLRYIEESELNRVSLVTVGGPLGAALAEVAQRQMQLSAVVSPGDAGWLSQVVGAGADAIICDADPVTAGEVVAALRDAGWQGTFLGGPELAAADFRAVAGEAAEGVAFVTPWPFPQDVPDSADFVAAYQAMGPHVESPGPLALSAYETTWRVLEALERDIAAHGRPTREGMATVLATAEGGDVSHYWYGIGVEGVLEHVE
jgi:branched-chain amino acid transport system substrate-binding protein